MKQFLTIFLMIATYALFSQTATNFTCNDCSGQSYDLFTELDAGKVVVICWVMPCGSCINPTTTTYSVVEDFQTTHPDKVVFYMADDFANTNCATLENWATSINIPASSFSLRFSNSSINMAHYGTFGMPKVVVLGGPERTVFYNANDAVNQTALTNAINLAIAATGTDEGITKSNSDISITPSPARSFIEVTSHNETITINKIACYSNQGRLLKTSTNLKLQTGMPHKINISEWAQGVYFIDIQTSKGNFLKKVVKVK